MTEESDSKKKSIDIPDVTTTFQSVALLEANGHAAVQEDEIQKRAQDEVGGPGMPII